MQRFVRILPLLLLILSVKQEASGQEIKMKGKRGFITFAPRAGITAHGGLGFEGGISAILIDDEPLVWSGTSIYTTYFRQQRSFQSSFDIDGFKVGIENSWAFFMWGLEVKTAFYNANTSTYISPKIGFSWMDVVNVEYLINIAGTNKDFPIQTNHQVGINMSLNGTIYRKVWKPFFLGKPTVNTP